MDVMRWGLTLVVMACCTSTTAGTFQNQIKVAGNDVIGQDVSGRNIWRYRSEAPIFLDRCENETYVVNGRELIDSAGRLLATNDRGMQCGGYDSARFETAASAWQSPYALTASSLGFVGPVIDESGNAWALVEDSVDSTSIVEEWDVLTGAWHAVYSLPTENFAIYGAIAVDSEGALTVAKLDGDGQGNAIVVAERFDPQTGWTAPTTLFSVPATSSYPEISHIYLEADSAGNVVVAIDPIPYGAGYIVYQKSINKWGAFQPFSLPIPADAVVPTVFEPNLSASPNLQHMQFSYASVSTSGSVAGLFVNRFDTATLAFTSPDMVPKSRNRAGYYSNAGDRIISSIDNNGDINVVWPLSAHLAGHGGTMASRYSTGKWQRAYQISDTELLLNSFASQSIAPSGTFVVGTPDGNGTTDVATLTVIQFDPRIGWGISTAATWNGTLLTRATVAWSDSADEAIGVFMLEPPASSDYHNLSYTVGKTGSWSASAPIDSSAQLVSFLQSIQINSEGNTILLFDPADTNFSVSTTYGSYLSQP